MQSNYDLQVDIGRQIFLDYDQDRLIDKFHLQADSQWIFLDYLHMPCRISRTDGRIEVCAESRWHECRSYNTVMTIYDLLCYHRGATLPQLSNQWCTVGGFIVTGIQDTETFTRKYAAIFDRHPEALTKACQHLGGIAETGKACADLTYRFWVTPFFPVLLQFWEGDEEFPPKLLLLWDKHADQFLHFETTFYLQGDLLERIRQQIER